MEKQKLFMLDSDGTLFDSFVLSYKYHSFLAKILHKNFWNNQQEFREWYDEDYRKNWGRLGITPRFENLARLVWKVMYNINKGMVKPYPGVDIMLEGLHNRGHVAVVSNNHIARVVDHLESFGLQQHVDMVVGLEMVGGKLKPHPYGLEFCINHFGSEKGSTLFVGDMNYDFMAAQNAGIPFVWASYGYQTRDKIKGDGFPTLEKPVDMLKIVV